MTDSFGSVDVYARVRGDELVVRPAAEYAGTYVSDEAEATLIAAADGNALVLKRRPDDVIRLSPLYRDAFRGPIGFVRFHRDSCQSDHQPQRHAGSGVGFALSAQDD